MTYRSLFAGLIALALLPRGAPAQTIDGKAAFEKVKGLAGTWSDPDSRAAGLSGKLRYEVISGNSVVMEVQFPGAPREMRSMYHLDKGELVMTHYCSGGTQPHLRLSKTASTSSKLVFEFAGGTNLDVAKDSHVHEGEILFLNDGTIEASWTAWAGGKPAGSNRFAVSRGK